MGLRSVVLGHAYPRVVEAASAQLALGSNFTRPATLELELAERMIELVPAAEMVKFAKNGSDVTTAAVRLARAFTGRDMVALPRGHPFFSVDDWFIGTTVVDAGIPKDVTKLSASWSYGDLESLERALRRAPGADRLRDHRDRHRLPPARGLPRRRQGALRARGRAADLRRDDHRPALGPGGRAALLRRHARHGDVRQGAGQRLQRLGARRPARRDGAGRPRARQAARVPALLHPRRRDARARRRAGHARRDGRAGRRRAPVADRRGAAGRAQRRRARGRASPSTSRRAGCRAARSSPSRTRACARCSCRRRARAAC